ncbi:498_t:CDS:2 [Scutellospora calospora]|uniref:498_t:CDS:1 n=1 Tax=Scutellospora calospora TaxID=85575 RepID=A0ACA9L9N6_9GLOM|nr:498_t:CDS:2 [Scutellospora calospora]
MSYYNPQVYGRPPQQSGYGPQSPQTPGPPLPPRQSGYGPQSLQNTGPPLPPRQSSQPAPNSAPLSQYNRPQSQPIPPLGPDPQLYYWFQAVDTDKSDWSPFNIETVRLMMNMFDTDNSGTIDFSEFVGLWRYIEDWKKCFQKFDVDGSGTINFQELKTALRTFGYNLSDNFIHLLLKKYDKYGRGDVTFDNFVQSCVTVKTLTDAFRRYDTDNDGWILINYEQGWLLTTDKVFDG